MSREGLLDDLEKIDDNQYERGYTSAIFTLLGEPVNFRCEDCVFSYMIKNFNGEYEERCKRDKCWIEEVVVDQILDDEILCEGEIDMSKKNLVWKLEEGEEVGTYEGIETNCINCGMRIAIRSASVIPICPDCEETRDKERGRRGSD